MAHTRVSIEGLGSASGGNVTWTGTSGQFTFAGLPAGAWLLSAQKPGYATARFGQADWKSPGTPIVLEAEGAFSAVLRMRKLGVVTGEVLDENRTPIPGAYALAYRAGTKLAAKGMGSTDDRGVFRIAGLEPGRYYIRTRAHRLEDKTSLLPTYFGQALKSPEARAVMVNLEEEMGGVTINPLPGVLSTLSGVVSGGAPATVYLYLDTGRQEAAADANGRFQFELVPPGQYEILAESVTGGQTRSAWQRISVAKESEFVALELASAPVLQLRCQEKDGKSFDSHAITVFARREPPEENSKRLSCGETVSLSPGIWSVAPLPPTSLYVDSIRAGRMGKTVQELELRPQQSVEILLTLSGKPASLRGKVSTADGLPAIGAPVYLNPVDPDLRSRTGGVRAGRTDSNGEFAFDGLPPGRYEASSSFYPVSETEEPDWTPGPGKAVELKENSDQKVELTLRQAP